ncbi:MAG: tRNA dihydrouridine synthase DusB [Oscillospiraceae bacterium]|jgi:tRNA-dihydrouridine synthase B|nr:tRNA dihydrouridine synthase DusB [Oscillospiraceae bacterium]
MVKIGTVEIDGLLALAPMAGVSDTAFRELCRREGAAYTCTEMVSAKALVYNDVKTKGLLRTGANEHPCAAQIFGSAPELMEDAAGLARALSGADVIDINMGCPVGKIAGNGDGCALMREPEKARKIIEAAVRGAGAPVTVKFRKGWDKGSVNAVEFGKMCQEAGASAVTVHGRTRTQLYSGAADWDLIREVKAALDIPVFANGDIFEPEDAVRILRRTGCDMAVIGRGAFCNPWLFAGANALLNGETPPALPPLSGRIAAAVRQFEAAAVYKGERAACLEARKHFAWYLHGVPHSGRYKAMAVRVETLEDIHRLARLISKNLNSGSGELR